MEHLETMTARFQHGPLRTVDADELKEAVAWHSADDCLVAFVPGRDRTHAYWACDRERALCDALRLYLDKHPFSAIYLEFVPVQSVAAVEAIGLTVHSEYLDFWLTRMPEVGSVQDANATVIR